ncbi:MAG: CRTAC1 family protein, partial [Myxococcota bacterium]|nr:CRTAC1 family protein [Myxococcota bacterium]
FGAGPNRVLRNDGGKGFTSITECGDAALSKQNSVGASALDYDRDGLVDIAVSGSKGGTVRLLRNKGDFVFEETTEAAGLKAKWFPSVHLTTGDVNDDGYPDIFVSVIGNNQLYINQKDGTFKEESNDRGVSRGSPVGFATYMFDADGDGDMDIMEATFAMASAKFMGGFGDFPAESFQAPVPSTPTMKPSALYINDGEGYFINASISVDDDPETPENEARVPAGFAPASVMGAQFIDFDLDGDMDAVFGPGSHPMENMQPLLVYRNDGMTEGENPHLKFTNVVPLSNPRYFGKFHGIGFADVDRDGDPDLYANNGGVILADRWRDLFLENTTSGKRWLHLRLEGVKSNKSAIGARVRVSVGDRVLTQEVAAGQGFGSTNSPYLIFGLGTSDMVDAVEIRWPSGGEQRLPALGADQALVVTEGVDELRRVY